MAGAGKGRGLSAEAMERILAVTRRLATPFDLTTMLSQVIDAARAILRAERGTVFLYDSRTHELYSTVATGVDTIRFPADRGIAGECDRLTSKGYQAVVLCSPQVRLQVKRMTEPTMPQLVVVSYNEIVKDVEVESEGMVVTE